MTNGRSIIGFAHRGMPGRAPDNSVEGYRLALAAGARALEGDVWVSADGQALLDHDGVARAGRRSRPLGELRRDQVPHLDTLDDLYRLCGVDFELSLDVKVDSALAATLGAARRAGAADRLWLCHPDWRVVSAWRALAPEVKLVDSTRLRKISEGVAARARALAEAGITALNLPYPEWSADSVRQCQAAGVLALAWHAHTPDALRQTIALGVDGLFSDDVEAMVGLLGPGGA